ncbi:beta strand repeat-containing protein, partial [Rhodocista pekingensis]
DTLVLVGSSYITLTAQGLVLNGIETVSFDNDAASRTVVIDQALNLAFGLSGSNSVSTAVAALDLSGKSLTGVDALASTSDTGTAFRLAANQIGSGKVASVTGGSGSGDSLRVDGKAIDFSSLTLSGIETLSNQQAGGGIAVTDTVLAGITAISGNAGWISSNGSYDVSSLTLSGITRLNSTSTGGPVTLTVDGGQFGSGRITEITAQAGADVTLATGSASLDLSGVSLGNVDALTSSNASGTAFRLAESQIGSGKVTSVTGGSGSGDSLRVDGTAVDLTSLTLSGIERFENQSKGGNLTVGQAAFDMAKAFTGTDGTLSFTAAVTDIDLTTRTLTGITTLLTQAAGGSVTITLKGDQVGSGALQNVGAPDSADVSLKVTGGSFDASGLVLTNIDLITTDSTTGVNFLGSGSNDRIRGGAGNDTISGNTGTDTLEGGGGEDVFVLSGPDFGLLGTTRITDADSGDIIRITGSNFAAGAVTKGDGSGLLANQIHVEAVGGGVTRLHVGIDGDAGADLTINLDGAYTADNFKTSGSDITVSLNQTPVITAPATSTLAENATAVTLGTISLADSDNDAQTVTLSLGSGSFAIDTTALTVVSDDTGTGRTLVVSGSLGALNTALAGLTVTPVPNTTGTVGFSIATQDGKGGTDSRTITLTLSDVDPVLAPQSFTVAENSAAGTVVGSVVASGDSNGLIWSISGGTGAGLFTIDAASGQIKVAPGAVLDFETTASYTLTVAVDDEDADTTADATTTVTITLGDVDETPVTPPPPVPVVIPPSPPTPPLPPAPPPTPVLPAPPPVVPATGTTTEDGVSVGRGSGSDSLTGRTVEQVVVAPVPTSRQDVTGTPTANADIRLGGSVTAPV